MRRLLIVLLLLAACDDEPAVVPGPVSPTSETVTHFGRMQLFAHEGPQAQIHLEGVADPLYFSQVRDGIAYLKGPERTAPILAVYVSDMGTAPSWDQPGADNWILAGAAFFVVGADVVGGMGAPEIAPFGTRDGADRFAATHGGAVMKLEDIPASAFHGPVDSSHSHGN